MAEIFLTSDWHFCHSQPFLWQPRGFSCVEEMNEAIIARHNEVVRPQDDVYVLGDLMLNDTDKGIECVNRLNGIKHIVLGNHDSHARVERYEKEIDNLHQITYALPLKHGKINLWLSHYATITANLDDDKKVWQRVWNVCGHSHRFDIWDEYGSRHIEMETNNCRPWNIEDVMQSIREKNRA